MSYDLEELKRLDAAATRRPWDVHTFHDTATAGVYGMCGGQYYMIAETTFADAHLIAAARNVLPELIARAALLRKWIALEEHHAATEADVDALIKETRRVLGE